MRIVRNDKIFTKKINNKWVILETNKKFVRELDETAGMIWGMCKEKITTEEIVQKISSKYHHPPDIIKKDVDEFVKKYLKEGFLKEISD